LSDSGIYDNSWLSRRADGRVSRAPADPGAARRGRSALSSAQAVFLTVFVILPSFVLSGVMFPYQLMPSGVRELGAILPLRWYQIGLRRLVLRGGDFGDVWVPFGALCVIFAVLLALVRWRMKPRLW